LFVHLDAVPFKRFRKPFQSRPAAPPRVAANRRRLPDIPPNRLSDPSANFRVPPNNPSEYHDFTVSLDEDFQAAQSRVKQLAQTPPPERLLELYSLYKQATEGDVTGARPGMLDFKGRAKYDAWAARQGTSKEAAKRAYVDLVQRLVAQG
jgi:acyl-CoA-binding protein